MQARYLDSKILNTLVVAGLVALSHVPAKAAEDTGVANWVMKGCRAWLQDPMPVNEAYRAGACSGKVAGVWDMATLVGQVCAPSGVNLEQATRVVGAYINARPARMHERFTLLAFEALQAAWPCR